MEENHNASIEGMFQPGITARILSAQPGCGPSPGSLQQIVRHGYRLQERVARRQQKHVVSQCVLSERESAYSFGRDLAKVDGPDRDFLLIAQGPEWCYTNFGRYPMLFWMPRASACHVNVPFPPYVPEGIVGYSEASIYETRRREMLLIVGVHLRAYRHPSSR